MEFGMEIIDNRLPRYRQHHRPIASIQRLCLDALIAADAVRKRIGNQVVINIGLKAEGTVKARIARARAKLRSLSHREESKQ